MREKGEKPPPPAQDEKTYAQGLGGWEGKRKTLVRKKKKKKKIVLMPPSTSLEADEQPPGQDVSPLRAEQCLLSNQVSPLAAAVGHARSSPRGYVAATASGAASVDPSFQDAAGLNVLATAALSSSGAPEMAPTPPTLLVSREKITSAAVLPLAVCDLIKDTVNTTPTVSQTCHHDTSLDILNMLCTQDVQCSMSTAVPSTSVGTSQAVVTFESDPMVTASSSPDCHHGSQKASLRPTSQVRLAHGNASRIVPPPSPMISSSALYDADAPLTQDCLELLANEWSE